MASSVMWRLRQAAAVVAKRHGIPAILPRLGVSGALLNISRCISRTSGFAPRMDLREVFATNLRRLRHAKRLSQDDLAYDAEVSRSYLSQLEKGVFFPSLRIVGRLADALNVEPAELLRLPQKAARRK